MHAAALLLLLTPPGHAVVAGAVPRPSRAEEQRRHCALLLERARAARENGNPEPEVPAACWRQGAAASPSAAPRRELTPREREQRAAARQRRAAARVNGWRNPDAGAFDGSVRCAGTPRFRAAPAGPRRSARAHAHTHARRPTYRLKPPQPPSPYVLPAAAALAAGTLQTTGFAPLDWLRNGLVVAGESFIQVGRIAWSPFGKMFELVGNGYGYIVRGEKIGAGHNYGRASLVAGMQSIAGYLRGSNIAQTDLVIGDLSRYDGRSIRARYVTTADGRRVRVAQRDLSHRDGRDMDVGYFMVDRQGRPTQGQHFVNFDHNLNGVQNGQYVRFDVARNWQLVRAMLGSPHFRLDARGPGRGYIFVSTAIKKALVDHARAIRDPLAEQADNVLHYWPGHGDHLHLRINEERPGYPDIRSA